MKPSSYFSQNLPKYFNLFYLLESANSILGKDQLDFKTHLSEGKKKYSQFSNVNFLTEEEKKRIKKELALNFWKSIEQETIKYSLGYNYLLKLDISDFYGR
ncbi:hypothetical protein ACP0AK_06615 [Listeria ivanovii]|nr:hypothetical protein [Listeria ivanovii]MCJ1716803.1 hypothetical protein [Listeria ivanovii]MCJ1721290.1 hypothetical protein [Listeria ivanovii]MCJ1734697.1 hypothetical protein [Listeria ivanovii]SNV36528.1 Uncharacterised protein [Listeria ivanovii subsp. ivanovii]SNV82638.1 Uncharacterised protein [Listeria ivanovii subsp. ivanovii]